MSPLRHCETTTWDPPNVMTPQHLVSQIYFETTTFYQLKKYFLLLTKFCLPDILLPIYFSAINFPPRHLANQTTFCFWNTFFKFIFIIIRKKLSGYIFFRSGYNRKNHRPKAGQPWWTAFLPERRGCAATPGMIA